MVHVPGFMKILEVLFLMKKSSDCGYNHLNCLQFYLCRRINAIDSIIKVLEVHTQDLEAKAFLRSEEVYEQKARVEEILFNMLPRFLLRYHICINYMTYPQKYCRDMYFWQLFSFFMMNFAEVWTLSNKKIGKQIMRLQGLKKAVINDWFWEMACFDTNRLVQLADKLDNTWVKRSLLEILCADNECFSIMDNIGYCTFVQLIFYFSSS